jgi:hypothetical protein
LPNIPIASCLLIIFAVYRDSISSPLNQGTKSTKFTKKEAPPAKKSEPILSPPSKPGLPKGRTVNIPSLGKRFIKKKWKAVDFE